MNLEFLLALHRKRIEDLKILKTFKYSGLVGVIIAAITKGLITPELNTESVLLVIAVGFAIFVMFDNSIEKIENDLYLIEDAIRELPEKN